MSKKDVYYFSHDNDARRDPKIINLRMKFGSSGYGMFWILIEVLRESKEYKIDVSDESSLMMLSIEMMCEVHEVEDFINHCISIRLIDTDGVYIWSNSLNERMIMYNEKKKRYSEMAKKRWSDKFPDEVTSKTDVEYSVNDFTKEESDKNTFNFKKALINLGVSEETASTWLAVRRKKGAVNSELAFKRIESQIIKTGFPAELCIRTAAEKSWHGFEAEYMKGINLSDSNNKMVY